MAETGTLAKLVLVLGLIALLAVLVFGVDAGPALLPSEITPQFVNPFDRAEAPIATHAFIPAQLVNGNLPSAFPTNVTVGCPDAEAELYQCVRDFNGTDAGASYATLQKVCPGSVSDSCRAIDFDLEGSALPGQILRSGFVDVWCRVRGITTDHYDIQVAQIEQWDPGGPAYVVITTGGDRAGCPTGTAFKKITLPIASGDVVFSTAGLAARLSMLLRIAGTSASVPTGLRMDVTTVRVRGDYQPDDTPGCAGADFFSNIGCQLGQFFDTFAKALQFVANGLLFVAEWVNLVLTFAGNLFLVLIWLFAIPGMPQEIQLFLNVFLAAMFGSLIYIIARLIRGSGPA